MVDTIDNLKSVPIPIARGGINKDIEPTSLEGIFSPSMKNVIIEPNRLRKRLGCQRLGGNLPLKGIGMKLIDYVDARGNLHTIAFTTEHAFEYDGSRGVWQVISRSTRVDGCDEGWVSGEEGFTVDHTNADVIEGAKSVRITVT